MRLEDVTTVGLEDVTTIRVLTTVGLEDMTTMSLEDNICRYLLCYHYTTGSYPTDTPTHA